MPRSSYNPPVSPCLSALAPRQSERTYAPALLPGSPASKPGLLQESNRIVLDADEPPAQSLRNNQVLSQEMEATVTSNVKSVITSMFSEQRAINNILL